jgi:hypothetical protein
VERRRQVKNVKCGLAFEIGLFGRRREPRIPQDGLGLDRRLDMDKDVRSSSVTCRGAGLSVRATGPYQDEMAAAVILNTGAAYEEVR